MADFVQTMKDWRRMCMAMEKLHPNDSCAGCRLEEYGCPAIYEDNSHVDFRDVEKQVSAWASEHPEPVYPSYIEAFGWAHKKTWAEIKDILANPIPADMAQKLGIEPKNG